MAQADTLYYGEHKLDRESQQILLYLHRNGPSEAGEVRNWAGFDQNQQVHYRADEYLTPAGLVESRPKHSGHKWAPLVYNLTEEGRESLEDGQGLEIMESIRTVEDVMEATEDAVSEAESAKQSVQSYRKKLYDLNRKYDEQYDGLKADINALKKVVNKHRPTHIEVNKEAYAAASDKQEETLDEVAALLEDLRDEIADPGDVDDVEGQVENLEESLGDLQSVVLQRFREMDARFEDLEERVTEVEGTKSSWFNR